MSNIVLWCMCTNYPWVATICSVLSGWLSFVKKVLCLIGLVFLVQVTAFKHRSMYQKSVAEANHIWSGANQHCKIILKLPKISDIDGLAGRRLKMLIKSFDLVYGLRINDIQCGFLSSLDNSLKVRTIKGMISCQYDAHLIIEEGPLERIHLQKFCRGCHYIISTGCAVAIFDEFWSGEWRKSIKLRAFVAVERYICAFWF